MILVIGIIVIIAASGIIYFTDFKDTQKFLEITDYEIIQKENSPLFLSVTVSENIPPVFDVNNYGFGWLGYDSEKLSGYTTNIHSDSKWHTESITINDVKQFCFDDAKLVISNVIINENKINVIIEQSDTTNFDRVISYQIVKDDNCHLGFAGIIIDEYKI